MRNRVLVLAATVSALVLAGTAHAQAVGPPVFSTPFGLLGGNGGEPYVSTDGAGNVVVSSPQGVGGGEGDYWVSHDHGATWPATPKNLGSLHGGGDEDNVFAPYDGSPYAGRLYIADLAATYSTVCTSTDHGNTFTAVGPVPDQSACNAEPATNGSVGPSSDRQWLTADKGGRAYLTYHEFNSAQPLAFTTTNGGADGFATSCGSIIGTNDPLIEQYVPQDITGGTLVSKPVVDAAGNLYILFTTTTQQENLGAAPGSVTGTFSEVFLAVSTDHCGTFNDYTIFDGYNSNLPCQQVPTCNTDQFGDIFNQLTIDPAGNLYAVAAGFVGTSPFATTSDIYLFKHNVADPLGTWSGPRQLLNDGQGHMMPALTAGIAPGQLAVGFFRTVNNKPNPNDPGAMWTYTVLESNDARVANPVFSVTDMTGGSGTSGNLYHIGDICNSGILCGLGAPGTGTDRSLADFTSAAVDSNGCPFFSFAGNPGGDTPQGPGLGYSGTTLNYVTKQTSNCFTSGPAANAPEAPLAAGLVLMGGAAAAALGLRRRRMQAR